MNEDIIEHGISNAEARRKQAQQRERDRRVLRDLLTDLGTLSKDETLNPDRVLTQLTNAIVFSSRVFREDDLKIIDISTDNGRNVDVRVRIGARD
jgi:hypothetical protein